MDALCGDGIPNEGLNQTSALVGLVNETSIPVNNCVSVTMMEEMRSQLEEHVRKEVKLQVEQHVKSLDEKCEALLESRTNEISTLRESLEEEKKERIDHEESFLKAFDDLVEEISNVGGKVIVLEKEWSNVGNVQTKIKALENRIQKLEEKERDSNLEKELVEKMSKLSNDLQVLDVNQTSRFSMLEERIEAMESKLKSQPMVRPVETTSSHSPRTGVNEAAVMMLDVSKHLETKFQEFKDNQTGKIVKLEARMEEIGRRERDHNSHQGTNTMNEISRDINEKLEQLEEGQTCKISVLEQQIEEIGKERAETNLKNDEFSKKIHEKLQKLEERQTTKITALEERIGEIEKEKEESNQVNEATKMISNLSSSMEAKFKSFGDTQTSKFAGLEKQIGEIVKWKEESIFQKQVTGKITNISKIIQNLQELAELQTSRVTALEEKSEEIKKLMKASSSKNEVKEQISILSKKLQELRDSQAGKITEMEGTVAEILKAKEAGFPNSSEQSRPDDGLEKDEEEGQGQTTKSRHNFKQTRKRVKLKSKTPNTDGKRKFKRSRRSELSEEQVCQAIENEQHASAPQTCSLPQTSPTQSMKTHGRDNSNLYEFKCLCGLGYSRMGDFEKHLQVYANESSQPQSPTNADVNKTDTPLGSKSFLKGRQSPSINRDVDNAFQSTSTETPQSKSRDKRVIRSGRILSPSSPSRNDEYSAIDDVTSTVCSDSTDIISESELGEDQHYSSIVVKEDDLNIYLKPTDGTEHNYPNSIDSTMESISKCAPRQFSEEVATTSNSVSTGGSSTVASSAKENGSNLRQLPIDSRESKPEAEGVNHAEGRKLMENGKKQFLCTCGENFTSRYLRSGHIRSNKKKGIVCDI